MAHISPGDAPQVDASLNGSAIHAPQPVRRDAWRPAVPMARCMLWQATPAHCCPSPRASACRGEQQQTLRLADIHCVLFERRIDTTSRSCPCLCSFAQVRFGHAPTSGFTRLPSVGGPGGGLPPGPGRNAALDHGLSPGMSPAMGGGASNMEMSRAMAARSTSGLTPSLTPGLSGSLSGLGARQADPVRSRSTAA